jgi:hypothetical protein
MSRRPLGMNGQQLSNRNPAGDYDMGLGIARYCQTFSV